MTFISKAKKVKIEIGSLSDCFSKVGSGYGVFFEGKVRIRFFLKGRIRILLYLVGRIRIVLFLEGRIRILLFLEGRIQINFIRLCNPEFSAELA